MQVGEALDGIGQGLLVDLRVVSFDAIAEGAIGDGGELENSWQTPTLVR